MQRIGYEIHQCRAETSGPVLASLEPLVWTCRPNPLTFTAKPYCESVKLEIEVSPEIAGRIAAMLAAF